MPVAIVTAREQGVEFVLVLAISVWIPMVPRPLQQGDLREAERIDLFVDGHSHTVLPEGLKVNDSLIVQTGEYLKNVGVVQIHVKNDKVTSMTPMLVPASEVLDPSTSAFAKSLGITEVPDDPEVSAYVDYMNKQLDAKMGVVIANVPVKLEGARENVRTKQTNLSKMICEAMNRSFRRRLYDHQRRWHPRFPSNAGPVTVRRCEQRPAVHQHHHRCRSDWCGCLCCPRAWLQPASWSERWILAD